jgi:PAS domain S-box-containing protein
MEEPDHIRKNHMRERVHNITDGESPQVRIYTLESEVSALREKLGLWNDIAEEGLFFHEKLIITEANDAFGRIVGYMAKELAGRRLKDLLDPDSFIRLKTCIESKDAQPIEIRIINREGTPVHVHAKSKFLVLKGKRRQIVLVQNITEFLKTRRHLEDSEEKHRLISSLLSDYVYTCKVQPGGPPEIGWVSGAIENISGYKPEEIDALEHGWFSIIHPDDVQKVAETVNSNYKDDEFYTNEYRIFDKNGNIRWLHDRSMCIQLNEETQELTLLGATKDITVKKLAEERLNERNLAYEKLNRELHRVNQQLSESEQKYKNLIENAPIGVGISVGERILFANQSVLNIYGIGSFEEFASRKLTDYMTPEAKKIVKERLRLYRQKISQSDTYRYEIIRPDGKIRMIQITSRDILFEGKECRQALITDITAHQETENALLQASNIFKHIQIGLLIYKLQDINDDRSLILQAMNPVSLKLIGLTSGENMIGKTIDEVFPNLRKSRIPQQYAEVVRTQIPIEFDDIFYEDQEINPAFFSVKVFPLPDQCVGISFENVSARRHAERELLTRNHELNNFVYKVSHDLRAPLSSIKGLINLSKLENDEIRYLPKIAERIDHLDGFIRDILSHSRNLNSAVIIEKVDLKSILEECFVELQYLNHSERVSKSITVKGEDFYSDKVRIYEICRNMISNAIKYQDMNKKSNYLKVSASINTKSAKIIFEDNGIGIDDAYVDKIFKMFYRATEESEGSGIGLYIVQQAIEKLYGTIDVTSRKGVGTKFFITIPNMIANKQ